MRQIYWGWLAASAAAFLVALLGLGLGETLAENRSQNPVTQGLLFSDNFNRSDLGSEYDIIDPDPNRLTISSGRLAIVGSNPRMNTVLLKRTFQGDFVATVSVSMEVAKNNYMGLTYYVDLKNRLLIGIAGAPACWVVPWREMDQFAGYPAATCAAISGVVDTWGDRRQPFFQKIVEGQENNIAERMLALSDRQLKEFSQNLETWYLQLRREGSRYTGLISTDGVHWTRIGSYVMVQPDGQIGFSVGSGGGVENASEFDDFTVQG